MNRLNEMRSYLAMNEEIEFSYKGLECFITPNNVVWEFWINDECVIKESDVNDTLRMYKNDDIRMYNFNCITDTIVEVITTCNTYTLLTVHLL